MRLSGNPKGGSKDTTGAGTVKEIALDTVVNQGRINFQRPLDPDWCEPLPNDIFDDGKGTANG